MKNKNIRPGRLVPANIRIKVYTEMIKIIKLGKVDFSCQEKPEYNKNFTISYPLCLALPCVLWGLKDFMQLSPLGEFWDHVYTPEMFPEIQDWVAEAKRYPFGPKNARRIEVLEAAIKSLQNEKQ